MERHRMFGQQRRGDDRQGGIPVAGPLDRACQPIPLSTMYRIGGTR
jgi:hypothetical protein